MASKRPSSNDKLPFKIVNYEGDNVSINLGLRSNEVSLGRITSKEQPPPPPPVSNQYLLFPMAKLNPLCNQCLINSPLNGWHCCKHCLRNSRDAELNCYLCVMCYSKPIDWLHRKAGVMEQMAAEGLGNVSVRMEYVNASHCPVCKVKAFRDKYNLFDEMSDVTNVSFDELIEAKAREMIEARELIREHARHEKAKLDKKLEMDAREQKKKQEITTSKLKSLLKKTKFDFIKA